MTTPEHTLVGVHLAFAMGRHRRIGLAAVTVAAVASNLPDLDGLPMLVDMSRFESGHRVWGHNVFVIGLMSLLVGGSQVVGRWADGMTDWLVRQLGGPPDRTNGLSNGSRALGGGGVRSRERFRELVGWIGIALIVQLVHLPCDMVVSGGRGLTDWPVAPLWPVSRTGYVLPLVPWGDVGPTVILMAGVIQMARVRGRYQSIALVTLTVLVLYLAGRGWMRGVW